MFKKLVPATLLLAMLGCSEDSGRDPWRLAPPAEAPELDDEAKRVHDMQMIRIFDQSLNDGEGDYVEKTANEVAQAIGTMCTSRHFVPSSNAPLNDCDDLFTFRAAELARTSCAADTYYQLAQAVTSPVEIKWANWMLGTTDWLIQPQSDAARLAMLLEASKLAKQAALRAANVLTEQTDVSLVYPGAPLTTCSFEDSALATRGGSRVLFYSADGTDQGTSDGRTLVAILVEALTSGERLMRKASEEAAQKMLSVAEWDRGSTDSFILGQERAFSREGLSRSAAAHLLVGGSEGLRLSTTANADGELDTASAFCTAQALSPSGSRALLALRQTGVDPARVLDGTPTSELVEAATGTWGSVRQRLQVLTGRTIASASDELGLTLDDFAEARLYLADELRAFNRSKTASIGNLGTFTRFAATSTDVPNRPDEYFTAIARAESAFGVHHVPKSLNAETTPDLATFEGVLQDAVAEALAELAPSDELLHELSPLFVAAQSWQNSRRALVSLTSGGVGWISIDVKAGDYLPLLTSATPMALTLVSGEDMLECALRGNIEGGTCSVVGTSVHSFGGSYFATITVSGAAGQALLKNRSYLVGKKANGEVELVASLPALGKWDILEELELKFAVMPEVERLAADMLRPSPKWCAHGAVQCNNNLFDERLPLENELNDDGNGIENSWRYYLGRAKEAAGVADQLGESYINAQLTTQRDEVSVQATEAQARERVEQHLEVLQSACGVSTDSDTLLSLFGGNGQLEDLSAGSCPCPANLEWIQGFGTHQCVGGKCVKVPARMIAQQDVATVSSRLKRCLGDNQVIELTTFGTRPLCVHNTAVTENLCKNDSFCPLVVPEDQSGSAQAAINYCSTKNSGVVWADGSQGYKTVWSKLNFYKTVDKEFSPFYRAQMGTIGLGQCRWIQKSGKVDGGFFKVTPYSRLLGNDPGQDRKECTPRSELPAAQAALGWGYDPNEVEIDRFLYKFPLWFTDGTTVAYNADHSDRSFGGNAFEMTACPTEEQLKDPAVMAKLEALPLKVKTWLLSQVSACMATRLENSLGRRLIAELPRDVIQVLQDTGPIGAFPTIGGEYAELVTTLRAALVQQQDNVRLIHEELRAYGEDLQRFNNAFEKQQLQRQVIGLEGSMLEQESIINTARLEQAEAQQDGALTVAAFSYVSHAITTGGFGLLDVSSIAGAIHGDEVLDQERRISAAQQAIIDLKLQANDLNLRMADLDVLQAQADARSALYGHVSSIQGLAEQVKIGRESMEGTLAALENLRFKARRALDAAVIAASPQLLKSEKKLQKVSSNVAEIQRLRYEDAFRNATRLAFLAKRAIELRLGVRFSEMTERLPLLDAPPASWENDVCVASGIDYARIQKASPGKLAGTVANGFLGTYVRKLENVVDAYQLAFAFEEGKDSVAISLKDDLFRSAAVCEEPSINLLAESSQVLVGGEQTGLAPIDGGSSTKLKAIVSNAWTPRGCGAGTLCVFAGDRQLQIGGAGELPYSSSADVYTNVVGAGLKQTVELATGRFVLSWYQDSADASADFSLVDSQGAALTAAASGSMDSHVAGTRTWKRRWLVFDVAGGVYDVVLTPNLGVGVYRYSTVGAPMLEAMAAGSEEATVGPAEFAVTGVSRMNRAPCRDLTGADFRKNYWSYHCERTCGVLGGSGCGAGSEVERCFWETTFRLSEKEIEAGRILQFGQFASGNFNYRLDQIALNVVATSPRDCSGIGGSSCYAMGYVPYSIHQRGPFTARNHSGALAELSLFDGRIEMAKGLALERYLTNPLSSEDKGLLETYMRSEFQGRPLDGNYAVRIWDDPTFNFDAVEDIQLYVDYRYWTPAK